MYGCQPHLIPPLTLTIVKIVMVAHAWFMECRMVGDSPHYFAFQPHSPQLPRAPHVLPPCPSFPVQHPDTYNSHVLTSVKHFSPNYNLQMGVQKALRPYNCGPYQQNMP